MCVLLSGSARGVSARASTPDPAPPPNSTGGISDELRADNEQLIARIKAKLSAADFATFRTKIGDFMAGKVSARAFHSVIERLGLQAEVGIMAALCPDLERSDQLLAVHTTYLASGTRSVAEVYHCCPLAPLVPSRGDSPYEGTLLISDVGPQTLQYIWSHHDK